MKTLLDITQENAVIRTKRMANVRGLQKECKEAEEILSMIRGTSYEETQERHTVLEQIKHLTALIESEQHAITLLVDALPGDVDNAVGLMQ